MTDDRAADLSRYLGEHVAEDVVRCGRSNGWEPRVPAHPWRAEDGWTEAQVWTLVVTHRDHTDQVVLKYSPRLTGEPAAYTAAERDCPPAFRRHLVPAAMPAYLPDRGGVLTFQRLAADEVRGCVPLARLPLADRVRACRLVVERVLRDWNGPEPGRDSEPLTTMPIRSYLTAETGAELSSRGSLDSWAGAAGLAADTVPWLRLPGDARVYPNPLALMRTGSPGADVPVTVLLGRGHRDLHGLNVLIPVVDGQPVVDRFLLIDLADYSGRTPLARDAIFLLLSSLAPALRELPPDRCAALADRLAGVAVPDAPDPVVALADIVLRTAVTAVHPPGTGWRAEWLAQLRLSTLALAISFTTFTNLGAKARWWFYRLAARIGRDLLESRRVPIPDTGHEVSGNPFHLPASVSSTAPVPVPAGAVPIQRLVARAWTAMPGTDPGPDELLRTAGEEIHRTGTDAERAVHLQRALLIDATRILGENDPTVLSLMHDLAYWLGRAGRTVASVRTYREVAQRRARQLGPRHPDTEHSWACSRAFGLGG